jgi:hypothetical protein
MTATINRKTRKGEPETRTDGSSQTRQNTRVDGFGYGFRPPRSSRLGFWTGLEPNRTVFPVQTRTSGGLPGPVDYTTVDLGMMQYLVYAALGVCFTWCMLYLVYALLGVCFTWCILYLVYALLGVCFTWCMLYLVYALLGACCTWC